VPAFTTLVATAATGELVDSAHLEASVVRLLLALLLCFAVIPEASAGAFTAVKQVPITKAQAETLQALGTKTLSQAGIVVTDAAIKPAKGRTLYKVAGTYVVIEGKPDMTADKVPTGKSTVTIDDGSGGGTLVICGSQSCSDCEFFTDTEDPGAMTCGGCSGCYTTSHRF
jgi:hypothetical protein